MTMKLTAFGYELTVEFRRVDYTKLVVKQVNKMLAGQSFEKSIDHKIARIKAVRQLSTMYPKWDIGRSGNMIGLAEAKEFVEANWTL